MERKRKKFNFSYSLQYHHCCTNAVPSSGEIVITDKDFEVLGTIATD